MNTDNKISKVNIIILNYNRLNDTINCLNSMLKIDYINYEIIVIDNYSSDNSFKELKYLYKKVTKINIIQTNQNLGYTGGINFGITLAMKDQPDYILLINNDTLVEKNFLSELINSMERNPDAAVSGGLILAEHDKSTIWYAGGKQIEWRGLAIHNSKGININKYNDYKIENVTFITGCMMLLRCKHLDKIGLLDERFFMYLDDIEYSKRIINKGFKLLYNPKSVIYHKILEKKDNPFICYYSARNRFLFINSSLVGINKIIANIYFAVVILLKLFIWRFFKNKYYNAAIFGLKDYFSKNFGKARGLQFLINNDPEN